MLAKFTLHKTVDNEDRLYRTLLARAPKGYRVSRTIFRAILGAGVCGCVAARYRIFDGMILPAMDAGWRPWHFGAIRRLTLPGVSRLYAFVGRRKLGWGIRSRVRSTLRLWFGGRSRLL